MTLPNDFSNREVPALVLLQWNHKTVHTTNIEHPKFHTVITHKRPDLDAQASLGFYLHWLFDVFQIEEKHEFDWTLNKSWRHLRLIFGSSCGSEYSEGSLYNLFSRSYELANVPIKHKSSLQRHLLGKHHEGQGVAQSETERMGWASSVYAKHYANPIPKQAVLGSAGFHRAEKYDPVWHDRVRAPESLTSKLFPQAEERIRVIVEAIAKAGAAIRQHMPNSALFRLPIFLDPEVQDWMQNVFPSDLEQANRNSGQVNLENVQSEIVAEALHATNARLDIIQQELAALREVMTPRSATTTASTAVPLGSAQQSLSQQDESPVEVVDDVLLEKERGGTYEDESGNVRAYALSSPKDPTKRRVKTELDLYLPKEHETWAVPGQVGSFPLPPFLGIKGVSWEMVFPYVKNPAPLWSVWKPRDLGMYESLKEVWLDWDRVRSDGKGVRPPLKEIEQEFKAKWRSSEAARQLWSKFKTLALFCHERINVKKQEWNEIQSFLAEEPYRLPKDQPDPLNRKLSQIGMPLSQIGMPQLHAYLKEREGPKKTRATKLKAVPAADNPADKDAVGENGALRDADGVRLDGNGDGPITRIDTTIGAAAFQQGQAVGPANPSVTPAKRPGGPEGGENGRENVAG
ncbi:hypothetical protein QFC20_004634 [Naganishia adeliensis]|uniref:Uncharacterized protein n=1 Tax=Naganishia adeliensis TaxID=92952 RepID=A0ACC2VYH5_9TREE|nr:hypothetical protein QFC20_004634 [Naganishia adeliensis]